MILGLAEKRARIQPRMSVWNLGRVVAMKGFGMVVAMRRLGDGGGNEGALGWWWP